MRNAFAQKLAELQQIQNELVLVYGDIGNKLFDKFKSLDNSKYINAGIAEASMISTAAGLAKGGFRPIVYTINSFLYLKSIEQIKLDICYPELPVIMVGTGGGFAYSELGTTHHSLEDIGILSTIPNLQILNPADSYEVQSALQWAIKSNRPTYIRIGKKGEELIHDKEINAHDQHFGPFQLINNLNAKSAVLSTGTISRNALSATMIANTTKEVDFWSFPQIKPLNMDFIIKKLTKYSTIIIIEEHNSFGGLGSILSFQIHKTNNMKIKLHFINSQDKFHTAAGSLSDIRIKLKLNSDEICKIIEAN
jgi:transketolase